MTLYAMFSRTHWIYRLSDTYCMRMDGVWIKGSEMAVGQTHAQHGEVVFIGTYEEISLRRSQEEAQRESPPETARMFLARHTRAMRQIEGTPATTRPVEGCVVMGGGADVDLLHGSRPDLLQCGSHEILIAAAPDADGRIASIRIRPNGEVLVNESAVGSDRDVLDGFRQVICAMLRVDSVLRFCACRYYAHYPKSDSQMTCPICKEKLS